MKNQEKFNSLISELITNMSLNNIDEQEKKDKEMMINTNSKQKKEEKWRKCHLKRGLSFEMRQKTQTKQRRKLN